MAKKDNSSFEQKLFKAADKLRKNIDTTKYKHVVLGLVFLKYRIREFENIVSMFDTKIFNNSTQLQTLKHTRYTLLPRLISNELRVYEFKESAV